MNSTEMMTKSLAKNFRLMLTMQEEMNTLVNPEWKKAKYKWYDAALMEAAEAFNMTPWAWWKTSSVEKLEATMVQLQLELVDIMHFTLSDLLERSGYTAKDYPEDHLESIAAEWIFSKMSTEAHKYSVPEKITTFQETMRIYISRIAVPTAHSLSGGTNMHNLFSMMELVGLDPLKCFALFIGKNTLNKFRQNNGYKKGTYQKVWDGKEDNYWLEQLLKNHPVPENESTEDYPLMLYEKLSEHYANIRTPA